MEWYITPQYVFEPTLEELQANIPELAECTHPLATAQVHTSVLILYNKYECVSGQPALAG